MCKRNEEFVESIVRLLVSCGMLLLFFIFIFLFLKSIRAVLGYA
jgi:ABC-type phosphate transport system permease subunit